MLVSSFVGMTKSKVYFHNLISFLHTVCKIAVFSTQKVDTTPKTRKKLSEFFYVFRRKRNIFGKEKV